MGEAVPPLALSRRAGWTKDSAISYLMQQAVENRGVLSLAAGLVDEASLPVREVGEASAHLASDTSHARRALQYGTSPGAEHLRSLVANHFNALEAATGNARAVTPGQVMLTTGSQQLLSLVCEVLLDPGDLCLVATPTYFVFLSTLNGVGAHAVPVATDADGMRPEGLRERLESLRTSGDLARVKLVYLVSYYDNPSGGSLADDRRGEIVRIVEEFSREHQIFILEDAAYREMRYDGPALPSVYASDADRRCVIYTQTFSKTFSPGVRVGFGVVPDALMAPLCDRKGNEDFGSANWNQHLLARVIESGAYAHHLDEVRAAYRTKRDAMVAAAEEFFGPLGGVSWVHPHGGLYVWMALPEHVPTGFRSPLFQKATKEHGVMYVPGELFYPNATTSYSPPRHEMRLSFGVLSPEQLREGMRRLSAAVREVL